MFTLTSDDIDKNAETYEIESDVTSIGKKCFYGSKLKSFSFQPEPELIDIGSDAFKDCIFLQEIDLSSCSKLKTIDVGAFNNCSSVINLKFPEGIEIISVSAFEYCRHLQEIDLSSCTELKSITRYSFSHCSNVINLKLPEGLEEIMEDAFYYDSGLTNVSLPSSVKTIWRGAFHSCLELTIFDIHRDSLLQSIGDGAFYKTKLSYLFLPKNLSMIYGQGIFIATLEIHPENPHLRYHDGLIYSNRTLCCYNSKTITSLTLDDEVDVIAEQAFLGCPTLKYINIKKTQIY